jgi:YcxB-like protein
MPLTITFTPTADEFLKGQRIFNRFLARPLVRFNYRFAIPVGVLLIADGVAGFLLRWNIWLNSLLAVYGAYLILCRTIIGPRRLKKEFAQYPDHGSDRTMEFHDQGILFQTSLSRGEIDWARFTRFVETDQLFVLLAPPRMLYTIPKRVFSLEELSQFRQLLQRKLPGK